MPSVTADEHRVPIRTLARSADRSGVVLPHAGTPSSASREVRPRGPTVALHPFVASPAFRQLFVGDVLVKVAERYFALLCAWWLLAGPHAQRSRLGALLTLESVPILVVGVLVGPLIDRANKARCMAVSTLLQGAMVAAATALLARDALSFPRLCVVAVAIGALIPVFEGAAAAMLPQVVGDDRLAGAAALQSMAVEFSNVIAAALAALVLSLSGFVVAAGVNAGLYVVAALVLSRLPAVPPAHAAAGRSYLHDLRAGLAYIARRPALASFVGVYVAELFLIVPLLVLMPLLVQAVRGGVIGWVAALETAFSAGAIAMALALSAGDTTRRLYGRTVLALTALGVSMLVLIGIRNPYAMLPNMVVMGACVTVLIGPSNVMFQQVIPDQMKGRFFGTVETLGAAATPLGYAAVGVAFSWAGVTGVLLGTGGGLLLLALVVLNAPRVAPRRGRLRGADRLGIAP